METNQYRDLAMRILAKNFIKISTRNFISNILKSIEQYGSITSNQSDALLGVAKDHGIDLVKIPESKEYEEIMGSCGICDSGLVQAQLKENGAWYVFKCRCQKYGARRLENYPVFSDRNLTEFEVSKPPKEVVH